VQSGPSDISFFEAGTKEYSSITEEAEFMA
jgi:hypothetical protein